MSEARVIPLRSAPADSAKRSRRTPVAPPVAAPPVAPPSGWEGKLADQSEVMVLMKTRKQDWTALISRLHELHPYQTPECIAVRIASGAPAYMAWLEAALEPEGK